MKKKDLFVILIIIALFLPFFISETVFQYYETFNKNHGFITSFIKFGILATFGEMVGLRIKTGSYYEKGFGVLPKAVVWGVLGVFIKIAFIIFSVGTPAVIIYSGIDISPQVLNSDIGFNKIIVAFFISFFMNIIFAPVMMTVHKITDQHITDNRGKLISLLKKMDVKGIMVGLNWEIMWGFVFKKTIPLFWIPAHTITFLLPSDYRVLFAAVLGVVLGVILSIASIKGKK